MTRAGAAAAGTARSIMVGAALTLLALAGGACRKPAELAHEAYIWQRQWTPAVAAAVRAQAGRFSGWRVLALEVVGESIVEVSPDHAALEGARLPVRAVVRIEGARAPLPVARLWAQLGPLLERWQAAGVRVAGIEIDHDCATAALADYAPWLRELRATLPRGYALSITALPTWLESPDLETLLAAVDASVLQVHAVQEPGRGLFDAAQARAWITAWDRRSPHRFAVALPTYGVRVEATADGDGLRAVDAEGAIPRTGSGGVELRPDPRAVAALLAGLRREPQARLATVAWFRLPVATDRRAWSATTLAAVVSGEPLLARFRVESMANDGGSIDLSLRNGGNLDAPPPAIELPPHCRLGDALGRYRLQTTAAGALQLAPGPDAWLEAGARMPVGWVRCDRGLPQEWEMK